MLKTGILSFFVLLMLLESFQWIQHWTLPLPLLIGCGALLALVANLHIWLPVVGRRTTTLEELPLTEPSSKL